MTGPGRLMSSPPDELGFQLHLTWLSAAEQMRYAAAVARRLPGMFALLGAGLIHPVHLRIARG